MVRLFKVWSEVDNWRGRDGVVLYWFVVNRRQPVVPYQQLIKDYEPGHYAAQWDEDFVKELFTEAEVQVLKEYCQQRFNQEPVIEEVELPIEKSGQMPYASIPLGKNNDIYFFAEEEGYALPFKVGVYFELVNCELTTIPDLWYLEAVFEQLNIEVSGQEALRQAARSIHEKYSLYVITEKPI